MQTDRSSFCGCKGIRTCLKCEHFYQLPSKDNASDIENYSVYFYCPDCDRCWPGSTASDNPHTSHRGVPIHLRGIYVLREFLSQNEETQLLQDLDSLPWDVSQSGRRKQNFGPKCNFKKRKIKVGDFKGFPAATEFVQKKLSEVALLSDFQTIEQCSLEYDPNRGASIDPHIDDCWIWGERIVTVNLLSDSVLTLRPYRGRPSSTKYNLDLAPVEFRKPPECQDNVLIRIPMPRRSLILLTAEARYGWEHEVLRKDISERRVCLAYREFTPPYLPGGIHQSLGADTLERAQLFW